MQTQTLGGERIGSGSKMEVQMHDYEMTTFNLNQDWKSTMAPGVLYPCLKMVGTNHGTFDIDIDSFVRTLPTRGPLFGSFKMQVDIYSVPFRLYQGLLHNNPTKVGMKMNQVYLPKLRLKTIDGKDAPRLAGTNDDNWQVNESALLKYMGISGWGRTANQNVTNYAERKIQCIPELGYYDIFKNYYANKQETNAYVIVPGNIVENDTKASYLTYRSSDGGSVVTSWETGQYELDVNYTDIYPGFGYFQITGKNLDLDKIYFFDDEDLTLQKIHELDYKGTWLLSWVKVHEDKGVIEGSIDWTELYTYLNGEEPDENSILTIFYKSEAKPSYTADILLRPFKLENIDDMRNALLSKNTLGSEFILGNEENDDWKSSSGSDGYGFPYSALFRQTSDGYTWNAFTMNGLVVKTYQSDIFNNWLDSEYIDGENGIAALSSVNVVSNKFTMDSLNLAEKIYEYLNRVLIAGGTYEDWQEATYGKGAIRKAETPMYIGGMSAEVMFEEVVSSAETEVSQGQGLQALGSLGGKGTQVGKNGGNDIHVKCDEPSYIIGIVSLTPRISYTQGNDWDRTELDTMDDLHKPVFDGIGFQDLIVEQMAWWNTVLDPNGGGIVHRDSAGKQIAWINYQTAVDKAYGDFAKTDGLAFMSLNRNYEHNNTINGVKDITTYIDPVKYNYAFAYDRLDAQNFWVQLAFKVKARRKMAGKQIPNL